MAEGRRGKQSKRKQALKDELEKPTKEEYAVAKYLRFNTSLNREGKFLSNNVHYFVGSKAVDILLESKWADKHSKSTPLFTSRSTCEFYCERLLKKGFFHRVQKAEKRDKKKRLKDATEKKMSKDEIPKKSERKSKKDKDEQDVEKEKESEEKEKDGKEICLKTSEEKTEKQKEETAAEERKRKKKKVKLDMHEQQRFIGGPDLYVWIYDPVPVKTFIIGLFLVFGSIAVCLFPLWPPEVRLGVYYLSIAAACCVGLILALCVIRVIIFGIVWLLTMGKVSFWLLPNLTEDVGFLESFRPTYQCEFKAKPAKQEQTAVAGGDNDDAKGAEVHTEEKEQNVDNLGSGENDDEASEDEDNNEGEDNGEAEDHEEAEESEVRADDSEAEDGSQQTGSSNDNGYEIVDPEEVDISEELKVSQPAPEAKDSAEDGDVKPAVRHRKGKNRRLD